MPRAKLFTRWEVNTNNEAVLARLADPDFDPWSSVLVSEPLPAAVTPAEPAPAADPVTYAAYDPRDIVLKCTAPAPAVLLLNDHYDPNWKVLEDGQRQPLLRCDYIMRGVQLAPGAYTVEFKFQPPFGLLYVSLTGIGLALVLLLFVLVAGRPRSAVG